MPCTLAIRFLGSNIRRGVRAFLSRRADRRRLYERSEAAAFGRLQEAAHHRDAGQTVQRLYQWLDRCKTVVKPARLEQAVITSRDDHFKEAVEGLLDRQFGLSDATQSNAVSADFEEALRQTGKRVNADDRARGSGASVLQTLNPE
ncbi:hypothetical protein [Nitrospira sp. KM1]|uniref:hypothetical protein n=1 Tax=Nitrospira sp. KM1 TaxID=1936990 RepID=UPI0015679D46|nr:hypothetical protein [Nitrospira sp. KM1]